MGIGFAESVLERPETQLAIEKVGRQSRTAEVAVQFAQRVGLGVGGDAEHDAGAVAFPQKRSGGGGEFQFTQQLDVAEKKVIAAGGVEGRAGRQGAPHDIRPVHFGVGDAGRVGGVVIPFDVLRTGSRKFLERTGRRILKKLRVQAVPERRYIRRRFVNVEQRPVNVTNDGSGLGNHGCHTPPKRIG